MKWEVKREGFTLYCSTWCMLLFNDIGGAMVSVRGRCGFKPNMVKPKIIKWVFVVSRLSKQH